MKLFELFDIPQYKIFCDLDGVLAAFDVGVKQLTGKYPHEQSSKAMWAAIYSIPDFFEKLPWIPEGRTLWNYIKPYNPTILTGLPASSNGEQQKRTWCAKHLGNNAVIVCNSKDKHKYATPTTILIDDRNDNIAQWKAAGGIGILHKTLPKTLAQLQKLGITPQ